MQNPKEEISKLFDSVFNEDRRWNKWFFTKVSRSEDLLWLERDGKVASAMHLMRYKLNFHGIQAGCSYIFGAMTAPAHRGEGLMSELMRIALKKACDRGDIFVALVPAGRELYLFYDRFGFSTVFFIEEKRYVKDHNFRKAEGYACPDVDFSFFSSLESRTDGMVIHSEEDFHALKSDLGFECGEMLGVENMTGDSRALAAYVRKGEDVIVKLLLSTDSRASETALAEISGRVPQSRMTIEALPSGYPILTESRGMCRLVDPLGAFGIIAAKYPYLKYNIRLKDTLLPENTAVYAIASGVCSKLPFDTSMRIDLQADASTMTSVMFSRERIADIIGFPGSPAFLALMWD